MHPSTLKQRRSESSDEDDSVSSMLYLFLPEHVWKLILQNIKSTKKLLKLRTASKLFCTMINDQLNSERRWEKLCYSRRITPWHAALKNTLFASNENNSLDEFVADQSNWKIMYFSYRKWESINKSQESFRITVTNSAPYNTTITFIAKTAEGVIMVINERYIVVNFLVDFNISDTQFINLPLSRRGSIVREVGFWNVEKTIIIYAKLEDRSICFWKAGSPRHISYHARSLGNIFCTDNDVLMNVNDNITRLAKYHYDHQSGSVSRQLVNIIRQPNDINLEEFQIIGLFGNANSITVACRKEKTILKLKIKIPESTTLQYIIYERTLYDLEISDVRKPYICYIPLSDVVLIANGNIHALIVVLLIITH
ncbi:uncharacterized protein LOC123267233 [Cotesia glomerata]|uniref:uncharacterized protein LOC123267233 n=1 Tax=Cotesia glomerata TaxID=32391 RepID=UPI001D01FA5E|nr:uncharacterized protein LOC123267233 [Cotesia glomerata]